ncbi:LOW QUALITY PROTEIN: uncharacterized protein LOC119576370 [Penaeus monodon]|uniref:LOW QUALITY PROTEIN: uncharacterized protein LOC119576370 n=1 Tax=Penaeus monodon TaxID=6687 RepID=UPI0018A6F5FD|nr:LOW QUALITY PROTEIN: uncharacterized protein LOC119576370 [Penaeus monodon]
MLTTVIACLMIFTVGQALPNLLVVSDVSVQNVTIRLTTQGVLPTTPGLYASSIEDSVSLKEANHAGVIPIVPRPSSHKISREEPGWITTDPPHLGESAVNFSTDVPDLNFGTRSPFVSEDISTTWDPDITTDVVTTVSDETRDTMTKEAVEGVSKRGTVVNCFCDADEVYVDGVCHPYPEGTVIQMKIVRHSSKIALTPITEKRVIIEDLECDTENGVRMLTFSGGEFTLRDRGDIVLSKEVGELGGLRIRDYCITHSLDEHRKLTWTVKVCVNPPNIPRCCPPGQAMKDNVCRPDRTPEPLAPPISADPYGPAISWPLIKTYEKPLHCSVEPMKALPLTPRVSYLASHARGLLHTWNAEETDNKFQYRFDHEFCVDGRQNLDGSASYSVKVCFESPIEQHQRLCTENVCVRKCCTMGEIMDNYLHLCVPSPAAEFAPRMNTTYNLVIGRPICNPSTPITDFLLSPDTGHLATWNTVLPPSDYCIDKFSDREGRISDGALACINLPSKWERAQNIVFPVCMTISLVFLLVIAVCYCATPIILNNTGWYHLCHVVSLIIAYFSSVIEFFNSALQPISCIGFAMLKQFGYLSAFFWLSVLCFDVWRTFRGLNNRLRPPRPIPPCVYRVYAWGGPLVICSVTLGLQYVDAADVPWLIKPHLGDYKCWFAAGMEQLVFFYLYIAILLFANCLFIGHTYWIKRKMDESLAALRADKNGNGKKTAPVVHSKRNYYSEFKTKFLLLALMSSCWVAEVLSWQIKPAEIWALTDILNTLQGFFIFVVFMQDRQKRQHLKEKFPNLFKIFENFFSKLKHFFRCSPCSVGTFSPYTYISTLNKKPSSSSIVSNLLTLISSIKTSITVFNVDNGKRSPQRPESFGSDNDIITLSHTPISQTSVSNVSRC